MAKLKTSSSRDVMEHRAIIKLCMPKNQRSWQKGLWMLLKIDLLKPWCMNGIPVSKMKGMLFFRGLEVLKHLHIRVARISQSQIISPCSAILGSNWAKIRNKNTMKNTAYRVTEIYYTFYNRLKWHNKCVKLHNYNKSCKRKQEWRSVSFHYCYQISMISRLWNKVK